MPDLPLLQLAERAGLAVDWIDANGRPQKVQPAVLRAILTGLGHPAGSAQDDQRRILTPRQALDVGSDYLVIGRPISQAADPAKALADVVAELA